MKIKFPKNLSDSVPEKAVKIYATCTPKTEHLFHMLNKSCRGLKNIELIPLPHADSLDYSLVAGHTAKDSYMNLMIERWRMLEGVIKKNLGENIAWIDVDCVFNRNNNIFTRLLNEYLTNNDFVFQYDDNSHMSNHANIGILGIYCSEKTLSFCKTWFEMIVEKKPEERQAGFPQLEWNWLIDEWNKKHANHKISFSCFPAEHVGPAAVGENGVLFHAVSTPTKLAAMKQALYGFEVESSLG